MFRSCPLIQDVDGFAVQPVGGPVGGDVSTVSPNTPDLLASDGLPDVLAVLDVLAGEQLPPIRRHHTIGDRWGLVIDYRGRTLQSPATMKEAATAVLRPLPAFALLAAFI